MHVRASISVGALAVVLAFLWGARSGECVHAQASEDLPNPYRLVDGFFEFPEGRKIGSTAGITIDRDGSSIWVFDRCGGQDCVGSTVAPIQKFDSSGKLVKSFGAGMFIRPHGIHVDKDGNVWVTDGEGPNGKDPAREGKGHQVFKFDQDGKLLMTLGTAGVAGDGPDTFNMPSAVYVAPNGDIFVGDGHGGRSNARVVKFSKDGTFIKAWGRRGTASGEFEAPHGLAMDSRGRLFVADRGNGRVQIYSQDGELLESWTQFGRPNGIFIDAHDNLYVADSASNEQKPPAKEGIRVGSAKDGTVVAFIPDDDPNGGSQESVAADNQGNIYSALTFGMALRKYSKH